MIDRRVKNRATGEIGSVVRGPYRKFRTDWVDVLFTNDFGEPGRYSRRYPVPPDGVLEWLEDC